MAADHEVLRLQQKVRDLEGLVRGLTQQNVGGMVHQVTTVPGHGNNFLNCNEAALAVTVAPVPLFGRLALRRVTAQVRNSGAGTSTVGMALYRTTLPVFDKSAPVTAQGIGLELVSPLGTRRVTTTISERFRFDLASDIIMDSDSAFFWIAYATTSIALTEWLTPLNSLSTDSILGRDCVDTLSSVTAPWPQKLTTNRARRQCPAITLRSALGVYVLGDTDDN